jgi:hypothetical protein
VPLSPNRIARLKRFDMSWQAALENLDTAGLSAAARADLDELKAAVQANLRQLDAESAQLAELAPVAPFAPDVVELVEARIRMEDMDARAAAGGITGVTQQVAEVRARLEAGLEGDGAPGAMMVTPTLARRGAAAADALRAGLEEWFGFYNGYDPLFTWWMGMPYAEVDAALSDYAAFLRGPITAADADNRGLVAGPATIAPAPRTLLPDVPDLQELLELPHDEMTAIVARFRGESGGGRGGRGDAEAPRDPAYYRAWLAALETLDFDALSRNAQVDYLFIKRTSEVAIARAGVTLPEDPPRKTDDSGIPGAARGRQGLILDLTEAMIPYSPEQLMVLAEREFAWQEEEMLKASRELGFGDDWKAALEHVKGMHPPPGGQPAVIRDMLYEAVDYLRMYDLITVPQVAGESLHMGMMSPERQLVNPFFTGGSRITVSYPTDTMSYDARIQSMRGNNTPFSHATAHHEMIPGHNLSGFMRSRFGDYRADLGGGGPFFGEGWAVYWELTLYERGFHDTPEERIGALFWLMHRSARIIFSLRFHMGQWSPQECIDFLVDRVGHERDNATAEVRRSFQGNYGPLYQAGYLLGALQLRGLRRELVDTGRMSDKRFHDEIMRQGSLPIAIIRLALTPEPLSRDMSIDWEFYGDLPEGP